MLPSNIGVLPSKKVVVLNGYSIRKWIYCIYAQIDSQKKISTIDNLSVPKMNRSNTFKQIFQLGYLILKGISR